MRSRMHDIVLRLPILRKHEQKRGRLETSGELRFTRASPSLSGIKNLPRSKCVAQDSEDT